jgi:hypothetical protein
MLIEKKWIVQNTTEDDYIEYERCTEHLKDVGFSPDEIGHMALCCHICPVPRQCHVTRDNVFLGAKTC